MIGYNGCDVEERQTTLQTLYHKYSVNMEKVSEADRIGRYKKAFDKLKTDLQKEVKEYAICNVLYLYIPPTEVGKEMIEKAKKIVIDNEDKLFNILLQQECGDAEEKKAFEELDEEALKLRQEFMTEVYIPQINHINQFMNGVA